jgi:hypothetical protein
LRCASIASHRHRARQFIRDTTGTWKISEVHSDTVVLAEPKIPVDNYAVNRDPSALLLSTLGMFYLSRQWLAA